MGLAQVGRGLEGRIQFDALAAGERRAAGAREFVALAQHGLDVAPLAQFHGTAPQVAPLRVARVGLQQRPGLRAVRGRLDAGRPLESRAQLRHDLLREEVIEMRERIEPGLLVEREPRQHRVLADGVPGLGQRPERQQGVGTRVAVGAGVRGAGLRLGLRHGATAIARRAWGDRQGGGGHLRLLCWLEPSMPGLNNPKQSEYSY